MGEFPWKVAPLLAEAKKVFLKATTATRSGEQHKEAVTKETDTEAKSKRMKKDKTGKDKKQRREKKSKVKDKKHKKHKDREPATEGEIVDTQTGEPMPCSTSPSHNLADELGLGGGDDSPVEAPGEDDRQTEGMTQHPRRQLWMPTKSGRARTNLSRTYSWFKLQLGGATTKNAEPQSSQSGAAT